jgi:hypothetical protein
VSLLVAPRLLASYLYKHGQYPIWQQACLDPDHHPLAAVPMAFLWALTESASVTWSWVLQVTPSSSERAT